MWVRDHGTVCPVRSSQKNRASHSSRLLSPISPEVRTLHELSGLGIFRIRTPLVWHQNRVTARCWTQDNGHACIPRLAKGADPPFAIVRTDPATRRDQCKNRRAEIGNAGKPPWIPWASRSNSDAPVAMHRLFPLPRCRQIAQSSYRARHGTQ